MEEKEESKQQSKKKVSYRVELGPNLTWIVTLIVVGAIVLLSNQ